MIALNTPKSTDWHYKLRSDAGKVCSVCGWPGNKKHRRIDPAEGIDGDWMYFHGSQTRVRHAAGNPDKADYKTQARIAKATAMVATGMSQAEIAKALDVHLATVQMWPSRYPELWQMMLDRAMERMVELVRLQAGTSEILADPNEYLRRAKAAERWATSRGVKLFDANGEMTLEKFYREWYQPTRLGDARPGTLAWHVICLRHWRLLTADPPLSAITATTLANFRDCLSRLAGIDRVTRIKANTVRPYLAFIQGLLDKAGPPGPRNRDAAGILERVPWVKPPQKVYDVPTIVSGQHLSDCYRAAVAMDVPKFEGFRPSAWWRALLVVAFNTGLRRGTLLSMRMEYIDWKRRLLTIPGAGMKTRRAIVLPLNDTAMEHLLAIRTDRELVFPWPSTSRMFYIALHRLQTAAGIAMADWFGLHDIRRTTATTLWEHNPAAAQLTLGHTTFATTQRHYVQAGGIIARALNTMPQPEAFVKGGAG